MNNYYLVRIELRELDSENKKLEYRALYTEMRKKGFTESFFDNDNDEYALPTGMYTMIKFSLSQGGVLLEAEDAIETALRPYYKSGWVSKYTIIVGGAAPVLSRHLEPVKSES